MKLCDEKCSKNICDIICKIKKNVLGIKIESSLPPELLKRDKRYVEEYIIEAIKKYR